MKLRRKSVLWLGLAVLALVLILATGAAHRRKEMERTQLSGAETCYITGGGALRVCHKASAEGIFFRPSSIQAGVNAQIIRYDGAHFATVLHSESQDLVHYRQLTGRVRPGDSIKGGTVDAGHDPAAALSAPPNLDYRIWGNLTDPHSLLYYPYRPETERGEGQGGGGNPMVVQGRRWAGDDRFYIFFVGVAFDDSHGEKAWRNILLEGRTRDFEHIELLEDDGHGGSLWMPFNGETTSPALIRSVNGRGIVGNQWAHRSRRGGVATAGLMGSIAEYGQTYYYFYTDQDPDDPRQNHLYVRTATDLSTNGAWSEARPIMDVPPQIVIRVAKAVGMDRWAVFYNCMRPGATIIPDICLQYTTDMSLTGPGGIGDLELFDGPTFTGKSRYALRLLGANEPGPEGWFFKGLHDYLVTGA